MKDGWREGGKGLRIRGCEKGERQRTGRGGSEGM